MKSDKIIDAPGTSCVILTPMIKEAIVPLAPGSILEVHSDDPAARVGVPAWSRLTGHELVNIIEKDESNTIFYIKRK
jgi:TusA-related sulfurtransferase